MRHNILVVRYGEIGVKGPFTRRKMHGLLANNIREAIVENGLGKPVVRVGSGRIFVSGLSDYDEASQIVSRVFGVTSVSPAYSEIYSDLSDLVEKAYHIILDDVRGRVFMVRARRAGEERFTSKDVERMLGQKLLVEGALRVDLEYPEVTVGIEVREGRFYLYTKTYRGPGGLPIGSEGRLLALLSGGIDSPVAAWMMMKRGAKVDMVYFDIGDKNHLESVVRVACILHKQWGYGYPQKLHIVPFKWLYPTIFSLPRGYRTVALKQAMYIMAEALAHKTRAKALITGESLAQVASQTLHNLIVTEKAVSIPIFRPLIGMDKEEITALSRKIGTYPISSKVKEFCAIAASKASTAVDEKKINTYTQNQELRKKMKTIATKQKQTLNLKETCTTIENHNV